MRNEYAGHPAQAQPVLVMGNCMEAHEIISGDIVLEEIAVPRSELVREALLGEERISNPLALSNDS